MVWKPQIDTRGFYLLLNSSIKVIVSSFYLALHLLMTIGNTVRLATSSTLI